MCLLNRLHDYYHASRFSQLLVYSQSVRPYSDQWDHRKSKEKLGGSTDGKKMKRRSYKGDCGGCSLLPFHERIREPSQTSTGWTHRINNQAWTTYLELCPVLSSTVLLAVRLHIPPCSPNFNKIASVSELFYTYRALTQYLLIQQSFWPLNLIWIFLAVWTNLTYLLLFESCDECYSFWGEIIYYFVCTRKETSRLGTLGPFLQPARHTRKTMATSSERLERSFEDSYCLTDLPSEVLVLILEYLPLQDLANVRLVSSVCSVWRLSTVCLAWTTD